MGFLDALFGGSEQQVTSSSSSKPKDVTPPEIQGLRGPFAQAIAGLLGFGPSTNLEGIPSFSASTGNPMVAPMAAGEQDMLTRLLAEGQGRADLLNKTTSGHFLPGSPGANPFLDAAIRAAQRPTLEGLEETLGRVLPGRFTQGGQFTQPGGSSAFDRAAAIATRGAAQSMGDIATNLTFGVTEAERGRQQQAISLGQEEVKTTISNLQAQALPRMIQDLGIERAQAEFKNRIAALLQALATVTAAPLTTIAQESKSSSTGTASSTGGIIPGISGLLTAWKG